MNRALLSRTFWEDNHGNKDGQLHDRITDLLERGADVTAQDGDGRTALHFAARNRVSHEAILLLVGVGSKVNAADAKNWTALYDAVSSDASPKVVATLLDKGAHVHAMDNPKQTALHVALEYDASPANVGLLLAAARYLSGRDPVDVGAIMSSEQMEASKKAVCQYFSSPSELAFLCQTEGFLKRIDPQHTEFIELYIAALSSSPDGEKLLEKDVLLPRVIAHEIRVGSKLEVLDSSSHDAKFALETAGIPLDNCR
jgi:ankyrin repeat protein